MRCFVAIELDADTRTALSQIGDAIRDHDAAWAGEKWVRPDNLHVTVAFLGDVAEGTIEPLSSAIGQRLAATHAFELPFTGLRAVPAARRASMLWAAYGDPDRRGAGLAAAIAEECRAFDIALEDRAFQAHITLVRARRPRHVGEALSDILVASATRIPEFLSVPSATLLTSTLTKTGPIYRPLVSWAFEPSETSS